LKVACGEEKALSFDSVENGGGEESNWTNEPLKPEGSAARNGVEGVEQTGLIQLTNQIDYARILGPMVKRSFVLEDQGR